MKLYEIPQELEAILAKTEETEGEITPEIALELEKLEQTLEWKVEALGKAIKNQSAFALAIKAEKDALAKREKTVVRNIEWMKEYLRSNLERLDRKDCETATCKVWRQTNGRPSLVVESDEYLPDEYKLCTLHLLPDEVPENLKPFIESLNVNKALLFDVLQASDSKELKIGDVVAARLVQGEHLRIK